MAIVLCDRVWRAGWIVIFPSADQGSSSQLKEKPNPHLPIIKRASCGRVGIHSGSGKIDHAHTLKVGLFTVPYYAYGRTVYGCSTGLFHPSTVPYKFFQNQ